MCREYGLSAATYYNWKAKYGGMEASDIKKMKDLEDENRRLKQMYADWAQKHHIELEFIQPGKPTQNSFIERFNSTYRTEVLDQYVFKNLFEVKAITESWIKEYNEERPHQSLGSLTPVQYLLTKQPEISSFEWH